MKPFADFLPSLASVSDPHDEIGDRQEELPEVEWLRTLIEEELQATEGWIRQTYPDKKTALGQEFDEGTEAQT